MAAKDDEKMEEGNKDKIYPSDCNEYKTESLTGRNINYTGIWNQRERHTSSYHNTSSTRIASRQLMSKKIKRSIREQEVYNRIGNKGIDLDSSWQTADTETFKKLRSGLHQE